MVQEAQKDHESINDKLGRRRRSMQNINVQPRPSTVAKENIKKKQQQQNPQSP
jgi:hypothetical protein